jgi:hypothetical protein
MKLCAHYSLLDTELDCLPQMKALVAKAEEFLDNVSQVIKGSGVRDCKEVDVDVEKTDYTDNTFGIRIYMGKNKIMSIKPAAHDLTQIAVARSWISVDFKDGRSIQFVFKSGLVPPKELPA